MEGRFHRALYIIQISFLLLVAGCGGKKEVSSISFPKEEEKTAILVQKAHFIQTDTQGRKILEIWADSSEGEEEKLNLKGVKGILFENNKPYAELFAPSATYKPNEGLLSLDKGAQLKDLKRGSEIVCNSLKVITKEKKIAGKDISLKWGDITMKGKEFQADWGLRKGMLKKEAFVKIDTRRRTRQ